MYEVYCRTYQRAFKVGMKILNFRKPELFEGENCLNELPAFIKTKNIHRVLIVTDEGITKIGLMDSLLTGLDEQQVAYAIYDKTVPNPTIQNIEEARALYIQNQCEAIIGFGGGSPIDCAKAVGARIVRPEKPVHKMKGLFKVNRKLPPFFAIPTTAGTGSEGTVAAVVSNPETHEKYPINDPVLIPHYAVLDPMLLLKLPKHITAATGMDALTHAVEAYIGKSNTNETREYAREAVQLIYDNLYKTYEEPENIKARSNMQHASYLAGLAFTRAYVGNIHAIAHTLSGFYNVPHGLANAVIMPYVLDFYGEAAHQPLAELADLIGISRGQTKKQQAEAFIQWIKDLNEKMGIPTKIEGILKKDIPQMVERALAEANPLYPVPVIMNKKEMAFLYMAIKA
jgi:alcohol dehydrogenase